MNYHFDINIDQQTLSIANDHREKIFRLGQQDTLFNIDATLDSVGSENHWFYFSLEMTWATLVKWQLTVRSRSNKFSNSTLTIEFIELSGMEINIPNEIESSVERMTEKIARTKEGLFLSPSDLIYIFLKLFQEMFKHLGLKDWPWDEKCQPNRFYYPVPTERDLRKQSEKLRQEAAKLEVIANFIGRCNW